MPLSRTPMSMFIAASTTTPEAVPALLHDSATIISSEPVGPSTQLIIELVHRDDTVPHLARGVAGQLTEAGITAQVFGSQQEAVDWLKGIAS